MKSRNYADRSVGRNKAATCRYQRPHSGIEASDGHASTLASATPGTRTLSEYSHLMAEGEPYAAAKQAQYVTIVNHFYDLVTDFYEYGWGHSFHFATRFKGETMREATARFEHFIALRLGLRPGLHVLDAGCGVGGPMRTIARFSGASILGVNNNDYQIKRANAHICAGLEGLCSVRKGAQS